MSDVTSKRLLSGHHAILCNGKRVGEAWRYPKVRNGKAFGMRLDGIYWRRGEPSRDGGFSTIAAPLLRDCLAIASTALGVHADSTASRGAVTGNGEPR